MPDQNLSPDSPQKRHLRRIHLKLLTDLKMQLGRKLAYFGLPSAEMLDVKLWRPVLDRIIAVERDSYTALSMARIADDIGVRDKTTIIQMSIEEVTRLIAMEEQVAGFALAKLSISDQRKIQLARSVGYDVINLDLCGGLLYPQESGDSFYLKMLKDIISFQERQLQPFILIMTLQLRDTGKQEYDAFIFDTLQFLAQVGIGIDDVKQFYAARTIKGQPPQLRRMRFCVPIYLNKIAYHAFQVKSLGAWYYKTFYHTVLFFEPRQKRGILGPWPPIDEIKELIQLPMERLEVDADGESVIITDLPGPVVT